MNSFDMKFAYVNMRASIFLSYIICFFLSIIFRLCSFFFKKPKKDVGIFLHSSTNSDGYKRRFAIFFKFFEDDNISYSLFSHVDENETHVLSNDNSRKQHYLLYKKIAWIRALQIPKAVYYKNIILQRSLFPLYPSYEKPIFEKILRKQNANIILDIWDPIHLWKPKLTFSSFKYVDKITVNTDLLINDFKKHFPKDKIVNWPISVDFSKCKIEKSKNEHNSEINLFYTGSKGNTIKYLEPIIPTLEQLSKRFKFNLLIMGSYAPKSDKLNIKHYKWDDKRFIDVIKNSHIGLYPNLQKDKTKNYTSGLNSLILKGKL